MKYYLLIATTAAVLFSQMGICQSSNEPAVRKNSFGNGEYLEEEPAPESGINMGVDTGIGEDASAEIFGSDTRSIDGDPQPSVEISADEVDEFFSETNEE